MLNDSIISLTFSELKDYLLNDLSIFNVAFIYILAYVLYKALGRYVYFKPEEHSSKINRTFLFISIFVVLIHFLSSKVLWHLQIENGQIWVYIVASLILVTGFTSLTFDRIVRSYKHARYERDWVYYYLPINKDTFKSITKRSERINDNTTQEWNDETVERTSENLHSDMMLNFFALIIFISININWIMQIDDTAAVLYSSICTFCVSILFVDQGVFKWLYFLRRKGYIKR